MQLEEFAEGNSILHRLDPRIKFLTLLPFIIVIALMKGLKGPFLGFCFSIILVIIGKLNFKKLLDRMLIVNVFVFFLWLCLPFSYPGNKFFHIGSLTAKAVIMQHTTIIAHRIIRVKATPLKSANMVMDMALQIANISMKDISCCCSTGYGRFEIPFANINKSEISAHGMGAFYMDNSIHTIIDGYV